MSGARYVTTQHFGRLGFEQTDVNGEPYVQVWKPHGPVWGLWHLDRFGGALNAQGIRIWEDWARQKAVDELNEKILGRTYQ